MKPYTKEHPFSPDYPPARVLRDAMSALEDAMAMRREPHKQYYLSTAYRVLQEELDKA
jgi:hypothetical protein